MIMQTQPQPDSSEISSDRPRILITGSTGLLGKPLVHRLTERFEVIGMDLSEPEWSEPHYHWIHCDLTDDDKIEAAMVQIKEQFGPKLASVVHLAAYYDFTGQPSDLYDKLTVNGTRRLIHALQEHLEVDQFMFSSSLLVMQPTEDERGLLDEKSPTRAEWAYPQSKLQAEEVLKNERGDISVVILRIAGIYDDFGHCLPIGQQIKRIYNKELESYLFPGDEDHGQSFVHTADVVQCIENAIDRRHSLGEYEIFLVGEPDVLSYETLQQLLGELIHGREWPSIEIPKAVAKAGAWVKNKLNEDEFIKSWMIDIADHHYAVDISKAKRLLDWQPQHRLQDTLPSIIGALKENPRRWFTEHNLPFLAETKDE